MQASRVWSIQKLETAPPAAASSSRLTSLVVHSHSLNARVRPYQSTRLGSRKQEARAAAAHSPKRKGKKQRNRQGGGRRARETQQRGQKASKPHGREGRGARTGKRGQALTIPAVVAASQLASKDVQGTGSRLLDFFLPDLAFVGVTFT